MLARDNLDALIEVTVHSGNGSMLRSIGFLWVSNSFNSLIRYLSQALAFCLLPTVLLEGCVQAAHVLLGLRGQASMIWPAIAPQI